MQYKSEAPGVRPDGQKWSYSSWLRTGWHHHLRVGVQATFCGRGRGDSDDEYGERATADTVPCKVLTIYTTAGRLNL